MTSASPVSGTRVAYADALRAVAIFAVILFHVLSNDRLIIRGKTHPVDHLGIWGVDCFFVLTGFLLSPPFLRSIVDSQSWPDVKLFAARRFLRIYPLYVVVLIAGVIDLSIRRQPPSAGDIAAHLLMLHSFFPAYTMSINVPLWTMSIDAAFYVILPLAAYALYSATHSWDRAARIRASWLAIAGTALASLLYRVAIAETLIVSGRATYLGVYTLLRNVAGMGIDFAIGCALALYFILSPVPQRSGAWYAAAMFLGVGLYAGVYKCVELEAGGAVGKALGYSLFDLFGGLSAGLLLYGAINGNFSILRRFVTLPVVATLSTLSYAMYLIHEPILLHVLPLVGDRIGTIRGAVELLFATMLPVLLVAFVAHRYLETPFLRLRDLRREGRPASVVGNVPVDLP